MTDHNALYQWRPDGWKNGYSNLASNNFEVLSEVYEAGADMIMILMLGSPDSVYANKGEKPDIPARTISGTWAFIADEVFE